MEEIMEVKFDGTLNPNDMNYLEYLMDSSKKGGVQTGITWSNEVYSYLFDDKHGIVDLQELQDVLGVYLVTEEI